MRDEQVLINPARRRGEPALSGCGLLLLNPAETARARKLAAGQGWQRHFLFNSSLYAAPERQDGAGDLCCWAGPAVGAPMAVLVLEKLAALGLRQLLVFGWCGGLGRGVELGDLVFPVAGIAEEGTSRHYPLTGTPQTAAALRQRFVRCLAPLASGRVHEGTVWTTDAPYREMRHKVEEHRRQGVLAVDMEFTALATVAAFRGVELAAAFLVSDLLTPKGWRPGFGARVIKERSREAVKILLTGTLAEAGGGGR